MKYFILFWALRTQGPPPGKLKVWNTHIQNNMFVPKNCPKWDCSYRKMLLNMLFWFLKKTVQSCLLFYIAFLETHCPKAVVENQVEKYRFKVYGYSFRGSQSFTHLLPFSRGFTREVCHLHICFPSQEGLLTEERICSSLGRLVNLCLEGLSQQEKQAESHKSCCP